MRALATTPNTIACLEGNGWAILKREDGETFNVPSDWLPEEGQNGHVLTLESFAVDKVSTLNFAIDAERERRTATKG